MKCVDVIYCLLFGGQPMCVVLHSPSAEYPASLQHTSLNALQQGLHPLQARDLTAVLGA